MALDILKLEDVVKNADGSLTARCPACATEKRDRRSNHLKIWEGGAFNCIKYSGDAEHNRKIFALAGVGFLVVQKIRPVAIRPWQG